MAALAASGVVLDRKIYSDMLCDDDDDEDDEGGRGRSNTGELDRLVW
jgi:hypothetical protein